MSVAEVVTLVFAGVVACSTTVYTYWTYRLWRSTRASVELTRMTSLMNLMAMLDKEARTAAAENRPDAAAVRDAINFLGDVFFEQIIEDMELDRNLDARKHLLRLATLLQSHGIPLPPSLAKLASAAADGAPHPPRAA